MVNKVMFKNVLFKKLFKPKIKNFIVNFLVCGTQKGGTTALDQYLRKHNNICMANRKEVHFFDNDKLFTTEPEYSDYHSYFSPKAEHDVFGEVTPIYMYWNDAPKRIFDYNPKMKLIVILRNPINRAFSHWNMEKLRNNESRTFMEAIEHELSNVQTTGRCQDRILSYIDRGYYFRQLIRLWKYFPKNQVLVLDQSSLIDNLDGTMKTIYSFLEIDSNEKIHPKIENALPYNKVINSKERNFLKEIYREDIVNLENALNWDCHSWLD
jgi:hypothetical protein